MTPRHADVLVIGAGAVGICAAHYLTEAGRQVVVVDQGEVCSGSSYGNAGLLVPSHSVPLAEPGIARKAMGWMLDPESPFYIQWRWDRDLISWLWQFWRASTRRKVERAIPFIRTLSFASLELYRQLEATEALDFGLAERGWLKLFLTQKGLDEEVASARLMAEVGIEHAVLGPEEISAVDDQVRTCAVGGVHYPQDAHIDPARFVRELARYTRDRGAEILEDTEVLGFDRTAGRVGGVRTTRGQIAADEIVLASGAWTPNMCRDLGLRLPMQPAKGYSVTYRRPSHAPTTPLYCAEKKVAMTVYEERMRLAGTLELAGMDQSVNEVRVRALTRALPEYLPDLDPEGLELDEVWRGLRPCTPDGLPYLGRAPGLENLVVAAGHAMIGISLGPVTGQVVAELVQGRDPGVDLALTAVSRYG